MVSGPISALKRMSRTRPTAKECYVVLRAISGPLRYRIVLLLAGARRGMTVTALADALGSSLSRVSHQLRILRQAKVVSATRRNREMIYALDTARLHAHVALRCL